MSRNLPFDFKHLKHYVAVVDSGKLIRAAELLNISQPALTQSIQTLEELLGASLLTRLPRGIEPTEAGTYFYKYAKRLLGDSDNAVRDVTLIATGNLGHVSIGASPLFVDQILSAVVTNAIREYPSLSLAVREATYTELFHGLNNRTIDIAITNFPSGTLPKDLEFEPLISLRTAFIIGRDHPLASQHAITSDQISSARLAIMHIPKPREFLDQLLRDAGADVTNAIEVNSLSVLKRLVINGSVISFIPEHLFQDEIASEQVKVLELPDMPSVRPAGIVLRKRSERRPQVEMVAALVRDICVSWAN